MSDQVVDKRNYYQMLKDFDVVTWLAPLWKKGWKWRAGDHKLQVETGMIPHIPWIFNSPGQDCFVWSSVLFDIVGGDPQHDDIQFIPEYCRNCYKVVVRPKTIKQLFALEKLQSNLGFQSKCGIEVRGYTPALYGGYFYCQGIEEGRERYKQVRDAVDSDHELGKDVEIYLKRSCTEMERKYGDSDKWDEITDKQRAIEKLVVDSIAYDPCIQDQPPHFLRYIHRRWIEWAFQNGDETYLEFTGGVPIEKPPVTYHEEK
jgi:hypothetical protein